MNNQEIERGVNNFPELGTYEYSKSILFNDVKNPKKRANCLLREYQKDLADLAEHYQEIKEIEFEYEEQERGNKDIHKEDLLRKIIGKLEREINVKDRAIEALEKATPAGYFKLLREHEKLQKDYQNLGKKCLDILKFHNFSSDFDELGNLSQAFAEAKTEIISLTGEKEAVTEEKSELIANRNNLENEVNDLIGTEWELLDFRTKFLALETFYNQAGLPKL
ncbi:30869_t:CDS:2 [Racocetra persica]|uniref:30869_t:CDS:1 n=1 Tax=Racocetra persica TaxID=160502 RepID=A0ACA9LFN3_9GLOM|nr:30869_t:CDS:2 [Racocetra persica]